MITVVNYLSAVDIPALTSIEESVFGVHGMGRKDFMSFFHKKNIVCASAYYGSKTAGYILCTVDKGRVWINRVLVDPTMRRKKVGSSLIAWLGSWAGQRVVYAVLNDPSYCESMLDFGIAYSTGKMPDADRNRDHQDFLRANGFRLVSVVRNDKSPASFYFRLGK